jgi:hypothetical protein
MNITLKFVLDFACICEPLVNDFKSRSGDKEVKDMAISTMKVVQVNKG